MMRIISFCLLLLYSLVGFADDVRQFPANAIFATIKEVSYPQVIVQEIPSNWGSSLLGMMFLSTSKLVMSPSSVIRGPNNNNLVQNYLPNLIDQPVAIQLDFQGRIWVIWQLRRDEVNWVIQQKRNVWISG
jgi:hypothetical protein